MPDPVTHYPQGLQRRRLHHLMRTDDTDLTELHPEPFDDDDRVEHEHLGAMLGDHRLRRSDCMSFDD